MSASATENPGLVEPAERYVRDGSRVDRVLSLRDGTFARTSESVRSDGRDLSASFNDAWLRRSTRVEVARKPLTVADLFSGCGGLSVGVHEAARAVGKSAQHVLAVDSNELALAVFGENFPEAQLHAEGIENLVDGELGEKPTTTERRLRQRFEGLDLVAGGPPCQGNSDLNNHTRRSDPRNRLYLRVARFAEIVRPRFVVVENVPGVAHDRSGVVKTTLTALKAMGYRVDAGRLTATDVGAAQLRKRHVILASLDEAVLPDVAGASLQFAAEARTVLDAIADLEVDPRNGAFDTPATHRPINRARIDYLFDHDIYDLPNEQRPDCHRLKPHSYVSVYGRMHPDRPAPTITSGFGSTGQGRFVHPLRRRTLTPHEAARLQGFPDWFSFKAAGGRRALQEMIGNAVPSRLAYAATASLLR